MFLTLIVIGAFAWRVLPFYFAKPPDLTTQNGGKIPEPLPTDPVRGNPRAAKTIIEFGDVECFYCGQIDPQITNLLSTNPDTRLVWKDCPLPSHPNARAAAEAARCAGDQDKYWEFHDLLMQNNDRLGADLYRQLAAQLNLDDKAFTACLDGGAKSAVVQASLAACAASGVDEIPWFSVNGKTFSGSDAIYELNSEINAK